jgi:hypothetical protein
MRTRRCFTASIRPDVVGVQRRLQAARLPSIELLKPPVGLAQLKAADASTEQPHSNRELLLRGLPWGWVSDRLWFVTSARRDSLLHPLYCCGGYDALLYRLATT